MTAHTEEQAWDQYDRTGWSGWVAHVVDGVLIGHYSWSDEPRSFEIRSIGV